MEEESKTDDERNPTNDDISALIQQLDVLHKRLAKDDKPLELAVLKAKKELVELNYQQKDRDEDRGDMKSRQENEYQHRRDIRALQEKTEAIGFAKITINTLVVVNAGAVLVILSFLGNRPF